MSLSIDKNHLARLKKLSKWNKGSTDTFPSKRHISEYLESTLFYWAINGVDDTSFIFFLNSKKEKDALKEIKGILKRTNIRISEKRVGPVLELKVYL